MKLAFFQRIIQFVRMDEFEFPGKPLGVPIVHCRHCRFWDAHMISRPTRTPEGLCRRKAPSPAIVSEDVDTGTSWPRTFEDDWCGEGEPVDPA